MDLEYDYCDLILKFKESVDEIYVKPCIQWMNYYKTFIEMKRKQARLMKKMKLESDFNTPQEHNSQVTTVFTAENMKNDFILRNN